MRVLRYNHQLMLVRLSAGLLAAASVASQGTPRPVSLIVSNGVVVTMDSARRVLAPGAVAIDAGEIAAVGSPDEIARSYRATQSIDADGDVVMPGLIRCHISWMPRGETMCGRQS
jgi:5-methylthioadenosine/S-adenosylhomocysteine deaminase